MTVATVEKIWWQACLARQETQHDWLHALQASELKSFSKRGLPTRHEEAWKYTDVAFLKKENYNTTLRKAEKGDAIISIKRAQLPDSIFIVFLNGHFAPGYSDLTRLPAGVIVCSMQDALLSHAEQLKTYLKPAIHARQSVFTSLNTALLTDGIFLHLPQGASVTAPLHILYLHTQQQDYVQGPRHVLIMDKNSEATVLEEHCAISQDNYFTNSVTEIHLDAHARLNFYKIQNDSSNAQHISQIFVHQQQESTLQMFQLTVGAHFAREDVFIDLNEAGAEASVSGFYLLTQDNQHSDHHIQIDHKSMHGVSDILYKGILDKKSHGVFNGKIHVHKDAQKTRSQQANHNLLLSSQAIIDTKPEFEIYADDVKCAHGSTVGQIDTEALFYLRSRGVAQQDALKLLTYAFAADVVSRVPQPEILRYMNALLNEKLAYES
jgi:Fe-S cluster assembly protein SufD